MSEHRKRISASTLKRQLEQEYNTEVPMRHIRNAIDALESSGLRIRKRGTYRVITSEHRDAIVSRLVYIGVVPDSTGMKSMPVPELVAYLSHRHPNVNISRHTTNALISQAERLGCEIRRFSNRTIVPPDTVRVIDELASGATTKPSCRCDVGSVFGRLTVISTEGPRSVDVCHCVCECGNESHPQRHALLSGNSTSCGCMRGVNRKTHGMTGTPLYGVWSRMIQRCTNKACKDFPNYGGRGISVCERWRESFAAFVDDMGERPSDDYQIGRIDNDGDYCPENCRWETFAQQQVNKRNNVMITAHGKTMAAPEWSRLTGIKECTIRDRKHQGWPDEDIVSFHANERKKQRRNVA